MCEGCGGDGVTNARFSRSDTGARKLHEACTERSSDNWTMTTPPCHMTLQSICEPGPPAARNDVFRHWMLQKITGQMGSRCQGRPGIGERRERCGITVQYTPGAGGGG